MYDKHAYIHTAYYGWSTLPLKINEDLDALLPRCDMELVLLDIWLFGKVHKIRKPTITANSVHYNGRYTKKCGYPLERICYNWECTKDSTM